MYKYNRVDYRTPGPFLDPYNTMQMVKKVRPHINPIKYTPCRSASIQKPR